MEHINSGSIMTYSAVQGAIVGGAIEGIEKFKDGQRISKKEILKKSIVTAIDFTIKSVSTIVIKIATDKRILVFIPKSTSFTKLSNIISVQVDNIKVIIRISTGELTIKSGIIKMIEATISTFTAVIASNNGTIIGMNLGMLVGNVAAVICSFIGGTLAYIIGDRGGYIISKYSEKIITNMSRHILVI
ncbi:hypothetical protein [uncultured Clostridium sp.]|uniref:hypothetical protein n=1 Tax=uncultured Clostridium sp. TaxID=59620 RepID=UPI0025CDD5E0|nr:hypothetical protein [uncultured Clostridium sp.]